MKITKKDTQRLTLPELGLLAFGMAWMGKGSFVAQKSILGTVEREQTALAGLIDKGYFIPEADGWRIASPSDETEKKQLSFGTLIANKHSYSIDTAEDPRGSLSRGSSYDSSLHAKACKPRSPKGSLVAKVKDVDEEGNDVTRSVEISTSDFKSLMAEWMTISAAELGSTPVVGGRNGKACKEILSRVGIEEAKACLKAAFADEFFRRAGAPLWLMASQLDRYRLAAKNTPLDKYSVTPKPTTELSQSTIYRPGARPY